jgi:hypothetical protein
MEVVKAGVFAALGVGKSGERAIKMCIFSVLLLHFCANAPFRAEAISILDTTLYEDYMGGENPIFCGRAEVGYAPAARSSR